MKIFRNWHNTNLVAICCIVAMLLFSSVVQFYMSWKGIQKEREYHAKLEATIGNDRITQLKNSIEDAITNMSPAFEQQIQNGGSTKELFVKLMDNNPELLGSCIAFIPNYYSDKGRLYAPYVYREGNNIVKKQLSFDYTEREWFKTVVESGKSGWCEPYMDEGGSHLVMTTFGFPIKNENDSTIAVLSGDIPMSELSQESADSEDSASSSQFIILIIQGFGLLLILAMVWSYLRQLKKSKDIENENSQMSNELSINKRLQKAIIPKDLPCTDNVEVKAKKLLAEDIKGDFYDAAIVGDKLHFCIGELSDKGTAATLTMVITRSIYHTTIHHEASAARILEETNRALCEIDENQFFGKLFIGVLDLKSGQLSYCNAGHCTPLLINNSEITRLDTLPNVPMGITTWNYEEQHTQMYPGSLLVLYTEGLIEAANQNGDMFGEKRLQLNIKAACDQNASPNNIIERVSAVAKRHIAGDKPIDDITVMAVSFKGYKN